MHYCLSSTVVAGNLNNKPGSTTHTTWEGPGLHLPSSPHTELGADGANPDC